MPTDLTGPGGPLWSTTLLMVLFLTMTPLYCMECQSLKRWSKLIAMYICNQFASVHMYLCSIRERRCVVSFSPLSMTLGGWQSRAELIDWCLFASSIVQQQNATRTIYVCIYIYVRVCVCVRERTIGIRKCVMINNFFWWLNFNANYCVIIGEGMEMKSRFLPY